MSKPPGPGPSAGRRAFHRAVLALPLVALDENDKWEKSWTDLFLKGKKIEKDAD